VEHVHLTTADGQILHGDLLVAPTSATPGPTPVVVVCHPHPQFGGDRLHPVVDAVFRRLNEAGFHSLRFDFRGSYGGGVSERLDVISAIDHVADRFSGSRVHVAGYSFGAAVALAVEDCRIASKVAVAPPLGTMPVPATSGPTLVLVPAHDQFCPPAATAAIVEHWSDVQLEVIEMTDHFLVGRAHAVADTVARWLAARERFSEPQPPSAP
jgi:uncharacterized protein